MKKNIELLKIAKKLENILRTNPVLDEDYFGEIIDMCVEGFLNKADFPKDDTVEKGMDNFIYNRDGIRDIVYDYVFGEIDEDKMIKRLESRAGEVELTDYKKD